jgi:predicted RecA/RadA family phage recombinase
MPGTFNQQGRTLTFIAPSGGVTNGVAVLVQNMVVIPTSTAAVGVAFEGDVEGCFTVTKATGAAWTTGQVLYFDTADGAFKTATNATARRAGFAAAPAASGDTTGSVKLAQVGAAVNVA